MYGLILQAQPDHPDANHNLGAMALQHGKAALGLPHFRAAWQVRPDYPQYWLSYASALIESQAVRHGATTDGATHPAGRAD
ncbi:MAG: hypothetical protein IPO19_14120 [Rhodoferax sp.]|nr:hypothetical protein [Rhodoferax sp.]